MGGGKSGNRTRLRADAMARQEAETPTTDGADFADGYGPKADPAPLRFRLRRGYRRRQGFRLRQCYQGTFDALGVPWNNAPALGVVGVYGGQVGAAGSGVPALPGCGRETRGEASLRRLLQAGWASAERRAHQS